MRSSFHKKLYTSTKKEHGLVEKVFDFKSGLNRNKLSLFLKVILNLRLHYQEHLSHLEKTSEINTHNLELIKSLIMDVGEVESFCRTQELTKASKIKVNDFNEQLGVFYVLAGSSYGAKVLLVQSKENGITDKCAYLNNLVSISTLQMNCLQKLIDKNNYQEEEVINAAQNTFNLIYKMALNELKKTTAKL